jgi:hypothetical protein
MNIRRVACIESELMRCERELRGLLVDARGSCVLQGDADAEDQLPAGVVLPPTDVSADGGGEMIGKWLKLVSFFEKLPSLVEADEELDETQKRSLATFNFSIRVSTSRVFGGCAYMRLTYGSGAYYLLLLPSGITCRRFNWSGYLSRTFDRRDRWRTLTSIVKQCEYFSGPVSVKHIVEDVLVKCYLHQIAHELAARLVQKFE